MTGDITLGYIRLPKTLSEIGLAVAEWTPAEIDEAIETARMIVRQIRKGIFWPPRDPDSRYTDDFAAICMDGYLGRKELIASLTEAYGEGEVKL